MSRRWMPVIALPCAVAVAVLALRAWHRRPPLPPPSAGYPIGAAPAFALRDDRGRPFNLASLRGHPSLLLFFRGAG